MTEEGAQSRSHFFCSCLSSGGLSIRLQRSQPLATVAYVAGACSAAVLESGVVPACCSGLIAVSFVRVVFKLREVCGSACARTSDFTRLPRRVGQVPMPSKVSITTWPYRCLPFRWLRQAAIRPHEVQGRPYQQPGEDGRPGPSASGLGRHAGQRSEDLNSRRGTG